MARFLYIPAVRREQPTAGSIHSQRDTQGRQQIRVAEWFEQAFYSSLIKQACTNSLIPVSSDEDDWNHLLSVLQFALEIGPSHARHGNI